MSKRCKALWASIGASVFVIGACSEVGQYVPAMICCAWLTFIAVCNWIAEWRDEKRAANSRKDEAALW